MDIKTLTKQIAEARAAHHAFFEKNPDATRAELEVSTARIRELNELLVAVITEGCKPCPNCGNAPHGIFHEGSKAPVEIGCLHCAFKVFKDESGKLLPIEQQPTFHVRVPADPDKSAREATVERWNAEQWDPPRESLRAKHAALTSA